MPTTVQAGREAPGQGKSSLAVPFSKITLKRLLLSLSIANLCFATTWAEIVGLVANPSARYFASEAPDVKLVWGVIIDVVLLSGIIFSGFVLRERNRRAFKITGTVLIGFFSLFALYQLQRSLNKALEDSVLGHWLSILKLGVVVIAALVVLRYRKRVLRGIRAFFLVLWPLFPVIALNALVLYHTVDLRNVGKGKAAGMLPPRANATRVIWIIFDELDQRMLFNARPNRIHPTEFDRLRAESIYADHVKTPAWDTVTSIPSLLTGQVLTKLKLNTSKLLVKANGCSQWKDFNSEPNLFRRARAAGFNTAVSGWHHPYCRVMGNSLSDCSWDVCATEVYSIERYLRSRPLYYNAIYLAGWQAYHVPFLYGLGWADSAPLLQRLIGEDRASVTRFVTENAVRVARNRDFDLVYIHFPIPHLPGIWDIKSGNFTTEHSNYVDNLQLADKLLGDVRRALEQAGDWDRSIILVSSDHPYREFSWGPPDTTAQSPHNTQPYVPFLLKLPGQHDEIVYNWEFNNVISADLLFDGLEGQVRTTSQAVKWLDAHAKSNSHTSESNCQ